MRLTFAGCTPGGNRAATAACAKILQGANLQCSICAPQSVSAARSGTQIIVSKYLTPTDKLLVS